MEIAANLALSASAVLLAGHTTATICTLRRQMRDAPKPLAVYPPLTIIRPLKGVDPFTWTALKSSFDMNCPDVEIIFCVASPSDPVIPLVQRLLARYPDRQAQLLIGDSYISENPKLNNLAKGWDALKTEWVAFIDSNVVLPQDAADQLFAKFDDMTGMVCSPPTGTHPADWQGRLECAFLNTYQSRWQTCADSIGYGFAQGKVMLFQRSLLDASGGLKCLGAEPAEDAAATRVVRAQGLRIRLVDSFFEQPIGSRHFLDVWRRQTRWACLRRATFPAQYAAEIASMPLTATGLLAWGCYATDLPGATFAAVFLGLWYAIEGLAAKVAGWPERLPDRILRDLLMPAVWLKGWLTRDFTWHGHVMRAERRGREDAIPVA